MKRCAAALAVLALGTAGCQSSSTPGKAGAEYEATDACHHFIEERLKAPSTAEFSDETVSGYDRNWTCTGHVDSQNSYGGIVRNAYRITVVKRGDLWYVVRLRGLTN